MRLKNILMLWLLCLLPIAASAQQTYNMGGTVYDETGDTFPGVSVYLRNRPGVGTATDMNGSFRIRADRGDVIVFSVLGYNSIEHLVENENPSMRVTMTVSATQLDEVVVTGLSTQRRISVIGAISSVGVSELQVPATSMSNILGGRVAGVISTLSSGEPGKNIAEFWIRGIGTFGASTSALVLIDGLEGDLNSIDPADVESFSVLKDASATAVYGVRGANGVVIVTTKRGQSGRLRITARTNFTFSRLSRMPEYLGAYDYARLANEAMVVRGEVPLYDELTMKIIQSRLDPDMYPDVNWQDEILKRNGFQQTYYISAAGGGDIARYFISLGDSNETSAYKVASDNPNRSGVGYNTYNYRLNLDINMTPSTTMYFGADGFMTLRSQPGIANTDYLWNAQSMLTPLTVPVMYSTGHIPSYGVQGEFLSPYVLLNHTGRSSNQSFTGKTTLALVQDLSVILNNLKLRMQGAYDNQSWFDESRTYLPALYRADGRNIDGSLIMRRTVEAADSRYISSQRQARKYHFESTLTWDKVINNDHRTSFLAYYYMNDSKDTRDIDRASAGLRSMYAIPKRYQGLSSRVTYGFKDTYMIDFNFGYTGSENFEPGRQFGFFPSVAVGWIPTNYDWLQSRAGWLNFLKLRASYGVVGSDRIADFRFPYLTLAQENLYAGWGYDPSGGVGETQFGANNLMWEKAIKGDIGIEGRLFNDRLSFVIDLFNDRRDGIFQHRESIPSYVGLQWSARPYGNVGQMRSYGTDGNIAYTQRINEEWDFTLRANYTYSQNEVVNWEQPPQKYPYQFYNGYPTDRIYGYIATGLFRNEQDIASSAVQTFGGVKVRPGDIKYKDVNGDGVIDSDDMVPLSDPTFPRLMYGFGGEVKYRNFTLGVLFKGTGKTDFYHVGYSHRDYGVNGPGYVPFWSGATGNVLTIVNDPANRWIPMDYALANGIDPALAENPNARFPRLTYGYNANNSQLSTWWKGDSRYLRLQEVTLNYHLRHDFLRKAGVESANIQFVGSNLYVWDKIGLWDPEQAFRNGRAYPIPARYSLQLYFNF